MGSQARTVVPAAVAVLVLASVAAVAAHVPAHPPTVVVPTATPTATDLTQVLPAGPATPPPTGIAWWLVLVGIGSLAVVLGPMLWLALRHGLGRRRDRAVEEPLEARDGAWPTGRLPEADDALAEAADRLATGADAREVVVACWVRLEAAADAAGHGRRPAETATDVARRWLAADDAAATTTATTTATAAATATATATERAAVDELAALFHEARYSTHAVTDDQRSRARAALAALLGARA